ncbi:MAG: cryptochrome/photolyase family protein [Phycisphaerales bacterium]|nr:cryptochrome/photolyase family protein [Phycisphaerales bacterium]
MAQARVGLILGDQLDASYPEAMGLDQDRDTLLMIEVAGESKTPTSHIQRTVLFLSAMRHHAQALRDDGWRVEYIELNQRGNTHRFDDEIARQLKMKKLGACERVCIEPGDHRVRGQIEAACERAEVDARFVADPHFLTTIEEFEDWARDRRELLMEHFYRWQRKRLSILMDGKDPVGGEWNYDKQNRKSFKSAPKLPPIPTYAIDDITREVIEGVKSSLPDLPGRIDTFNWPVTRRQATHALNDFIKHRLPSFGDHQDAMWTGETTLNHSLLSPALNLKLLNPREVIDKAIDAYESGEAPLNSVEGFVRQIIGWREFVRGVYYTQEPDYSESNALDCHGQLPEFYWSGDTDMKCMSEAIGSVLDHAYGHHIERLMVTGNFALLAGIEPRQVNDWYRGMYVDAIDWVTTPNTVGMALYADGGVVGTKPYAASGKYISRMSNYCKHCRFDVNKKSGDDACPFNAMYWAFLHRNRERFEGNRRMALVLKNLDRFGNDELTELSVSVEKNREKWGIGPIEES